MQIKKERNDPRIKTIKMETLNANYRKRFTKAHNSEMVDLFVQFQFRIVTKMRYLQL